jgi:peptidoglycan/LPS O-acetylase OafA/YrhL
MAVIVNHFHKGLMPCGFLGVDVFFVISGYVITASLAKRSASTFTEFLLSFYVRRLKRLVPALVVFSVVTGFLITLFNPGPGASLRTGIASLFGLSNLYLLKESTNYFGVSAEVNAFTHTWSLGVEEQFYLLFPALIWFTGFGHQHRHGRRNAFVALGLLALLSLLFFCFLYGYNKPAAFFLMPTRFWELSSGAMLFLVLQGKSTTSRSSESRKTSLFLLIALIAIFFIPEGLALLATILCVFATLLLIRFITPLDTAYKLLTHPFALYLGLISYSLYLWHWGILSISRWTVGIHLWTAPFQLSLMILLASVSYNYVEKPFRHRAWPGGNKGTMIYAIAASIAASGILLSFGLLRNTLYAGQRYFGYSSYPDNVIKGTPINHANCMLSGGSEFTEHRFNQCRLPGKPGLPTVIFLGSSHAMHLAGLGEFLNQKGYGIAFLTAQGVNFNPIQQGPGLRFNFKTSQEQSISSIITRKLKPGDVVVVSNRYPQDSFSSEDSFSRMSQKAGLNRALLNWSAMLKKKGVTVIHMLPLQEYPFFDINQCSPQWFNAGMRGTKICKPINPVQRTGQIQEIRTLLPENEHFIHFDQRSVLCADGAIDCKPFDEAAHRPIFSNPDHLADHGASLLAKEFERLLSRINSKN